MPKMIWRLNLAMIAWMMERFERLLFSEYKETSAIYHQMEEPVSQELLSHSIQPPLLSFERVGYHYALRKGKCCQTIGGKGRSWRVRGGCCCQGSWQKMLDQAKSPCSFLKFNLPLLEIWSLSSLLVSLSHKFTLTVIQT